MPARLALAIFAALLAGCAGPHAVRDSGQRTQDSVRCASVAVTPGSTSYAGCMPVSPSMTLGPVPGASPSDGGGGGGGGGM